MSEQDEAVVVECDLDAPVEKVWRALTEPDLVDAWLGPDEAGVEIGEIHEVAPGRELTYGWRDVDGGRHSLVTFTLSETEDGSHLRIVHEPIAARLGLCGLPRRPVQARACMSRRRVETCMCRAA